MMNGPGFPPALRRFFAFLASPAIPFFTLPVFAMILVGGTVTQRYIGLYEAQKIFFSSLPAIMLLGVLTLSLTAKFLFYSAWTKKRAGINLAHLGILVLLGGGFLTAVSAKEGSMVIPEQEETGFFRDYHARDLTITWDGKEEVFPFATLRPGRRIALGDGAEIEILDRCRSCDIERREGKAPEARSMAQFMRLVPGRPKLQDEENVVGVTIRLKSGDAAQDGLYILFDPMPKPAEIAVAGKTVSLMMDKRRYTLPFALHLNDFQAEHHPGTAMARAYHSDITVKDASLSWPVRIEMNAPLRYKGYTFFQSSFFKPEGDKEYSVLAVVQNRAWLFPYIGTGLMAFGLLLHLVIMTIRRRKTA